jgi:hypothetical protein
MGIGGPVAACAVGEWETTEITGSATGMAGSGTVTGGAGATVKVGANGITEIDFTNMKPASFKATALNTAIEGTFVYAGTTSGQIRTGDATSQSGTWEPVGTIDWTNVKVTVDLTKPASLKLLDNVGISTYTGDKAAQSGGVVDVDPILGKAKYQCMGDTMTLSPVDGNGLTWELSNK